MTWTGRRKFSYTVLFCIVIVAVLGYVGFKFLYHPPTCFDGTWNQNESGIDCGGGCELLCPTDFISPRISWERTSYVAKGLYSVLAYGENLNTDGYLIDVGYKIRLYDTDGVLITAREGSVDISPASRFAIFEPNIQTGERVPVRAIVEFDESLVWKKFDGEYRFPASVGQYSIENASTTPRLSVKIRNQGLATLPRMKVTAIVYNTVGEAFAFSQTYIDSIGPQGEVSALYTWLVPFKEMVGQVEFVVSKEWDRR